MPESPDLQKETKYEQRLELVTKFFASFEGLKFINSDGKPITLHIRNIPSSKGGVVLSKTNFLVEFEGYPSVDLSSDKLAPEENYIKFSADILSDEPKIIPDYAKLQNFDLKSKNIFSQIRRHIGAHFPPDFTYAVIIDNERTKTQLLTVREKVKTKMIDEDQGKTEVLNNYKVQERISSGFNYIRVIFLYEDSLVMIDSKKVNGVDGVDFDVDFDLYAFDPRG